MPENWINKNCIFCDNNLNSKVKFKQNFSYENINSDVFSARRSTDHYHYQILQCSEHSLVFSSPILPFEEISNLYKESKQNYDNETKYISTSYVKYIKDNINLFKNKNKALDIGCGSGFFMQELINSGFSEVYGVEPSIEAVSKAGIHKEHIFNGILEDSDYKENTFDLISCFQTLDHLTDPLQALKIIYKILNTNGIAYFIVHNEKGLQAKIFGERSPIYDIEHIYLYNNKTLKMICEKAGFKILAQFNIKNSYPLNYWVRMAPLPFKNFLLKVIKIFNVNDTNISINPGNIGIFITKE